MRTPDHASTVLLLVALATAGVAGASACGADSRSAFEDTIDAGGDSGGNELVRIEVAPADVSLLAGDTNQAQVFTAKGQYQDGTTRDVTSLVTWKASPDSIVTANGPHVVPRGSRGGDAAISAFIGGVTGTAAIHVKWARTVLGQDVTPGSASRFKGAAEDATLAPTLAYPISGVLMPPNIPAITVQFKPAAPTNLFELSFVGPNVELDYIASCPTTIGMTGGCGVIPDAATWSSLTATLAGLDTATLTVRAAGTAAGKIGTSAGVKVQIAAENLAGGLYYFNTKAAPPDVKPGIFRYDFTTGKVGPFFTQGQCAGCHALTTDGTKMLAPICTDLRTGCGRPLQLAVVDVATKTVLTPPFPVGDSDTQAWSPDNAFYVTNPGCGTVATASPFACATPATGTLTLVSAKTNTAVGVVPTGAGAMYPSFSNDGKTLVYARGGTYRGPLSIQKSSLYTIDFDGTTDPPVWGVEKPLVTASATDLENNYHPSFSPDDKWVVFSRSHCQAGDNPNSADINVNVCDSYNDTTARSWVVSAAGGTPVELALGNGAGRNTASWPKWAPFKTRYKGGEVFWLTVSSARDYGYSAVHGHDAQGNPSSGVTQLWLVAFDPARAAAVGDPSFAPLWLPFQDVASSNHIGQWATKIVGTVN